MSDLSEEYEFSQYKELNQLDKKNKVVVVQDIRDNRIWVRKNIENFINTNKEDFIDIPLHLYLATLLKKYSISKNEAINNSAISQIYGYQIFSGKRPNPSRDKILQLIFGMSLNLEDSQRLLKLAGVSELYPRIKRDSIILFAINKGLTIEKCDELLFELGEKTIINKD